MRFGIRSEDMNITDLEPQRVHDMNLWWTKPQSSDLMACLEKLRQKKMLEYSDLMIKWKAEPNSNFKEAADATLQEAVELEHAFKVLKSFFPDGPFIARIEL